MQGCFPLWCRFFPKVLHFPQVATSVEVLHWLVVTSILFCWEWIPLQWTLKSKWRFQEFAYTSSGCILVGNLSDWIWSYLMDICIVTWCFFNLRTWAFCFAANPTWSMWVVYCNPSDPEAHLECFGRGQRSKWHCHSQCQSFGLVAQHGDNVAFLDPLGFCFARPRTVPFGWLWSQGTWKVLLMEEILHQLIGSSTHYSQVFICFYTSQVVQDFFHQQYHNMVIFHVWTSRDSLWVGAGRIRPFQLEVSLPLFGTNVAARPELRWTTPLVADESFSPNEAAWRRRKHWQSWC